MRCKIILNDAAKWEAPEWIARSLIAHLEPWFLHSESRTEKGLMNLLDGHATKIDVSKATASELREFVRLMRFARRNVNPPEKWHKPASALEFFAAYDRLLAILNLDARLRGDNE
jgi:hypothetical protein